MTISIDTVNPYREGTKRHVIAWNLINGRSQDDCYKALEQWVKDQEQPFVFGRSPRAGETRRVPKPMKEQLAELKLEIARVAKELGDRS